MGFTGAERTRSVTTPALIARTGPEPAAAAFNFIISILSSSELPDASVGARPKPKARPSKKATTSLGASPTRECQIVFEISR
jgi:hypothetical protein